MRSMQADLQKSSLSEVLHVMTHRMSSYTLSPCKIKGPSLKNGITESIPQ
jgi:hypothetical protein